jgi:hypothetical protein
MCIYGGNNNKEEYNIVVQILFDEYIHKKGETQLKVWEVQTLKQRNNYMS